MDAEEKAFWKETYEDVIRLDTEANATSRALSSYLITFSTLMITLTTFFLGQSNVVIRFNSYQKGFLVAGLVSLLLSIAFGICEHFSVKNFYKQSALKHIEVIKMAPLNVSIAELHGHRFNTLKSLPVESNSIMLYAQIAAIGIGVILYFILLLTVLY